MPEGFELIEYKIHTYDSWVVKNTETGEIWYPLRHIMQNIFGIKSFAVNNMTLKQINSTMRLYMQVPGRNINNMSKENQPKSVVIFGNEWCIKNYIRRRIILGEDYNNKARDLLIEIFADKWGFRVKGFGYLTHVPPKLEKYPLMEQIAIELTDNTELWERCVECEKYYPATRQFYDGHKDSTCRKCKGKTFIIKSRDIYPELEKILKEKGIIK